MKNKTKEIIKQYIKDIEESYKDESYKYAFELAILSISPIEIGELITQYEDEDDITKEDITKIKKQLVKEKGIKDYLGFLKHIKELNENDLIEIKEK